MHARRMMRMALSYAVLLMSTCVFFAPLALANTPEERRADLLSAGVKVNVESGVQHANDFTMGPGRFSLQLNPGETQTVELQITDRADGTRSFVFEREDVGANDDFLHPQETTRLFGGEEGPYPARTWVRPAVPSLELSFGERAFVPVTISVPKDAEPGDHYAALLLKRQLGPEEVTDKGFTIVSRVGVLFLITVKGPVVQNASVTSLTSRAKLYWYFPAAFDLRVKNEGTVYASPSGVIRIKNLLGLTVDEIPVKDWVVLRNSSRTVTYEWHPRFALGFYRAVADISIFDTVMPPVSASFWMIPALPVLIVVLLIFVASFAIQYYLSRFEIRRKKG